MFEKLEILRTAGALARYAGARQDAIARNVANADTPGYRAADLPDFAETLGDGGAPQTDGRDPAEWEPPAARARAGGDAPNGNSVSLEAEMVNAADAKQQHDMALAIYRSTTEILRASLGRGR